MSKWTQERIDSARATVADELAAPYSEEAKLWATDYRAALDEIERLRAVVAGGCGCDCESCQRCSAYAPQSGAELREEIERLRGELACTESQLTSAGSSRRHFYRQADDAAEELDEARARIAELENDLRTVQAVKQFLRESYEARGEAMEFMLEKIEALEATQRWIPVEERLPEDGQRVVYEDEDGFTEHCIWSDRYRVNVMPGARAVRWYPLPEGD